MTATGTGSLRSGQEFDTAFREGIAVSGPLFVVRARRNGLDVARTAFAVGKRIAPLATQRNRAKRRLREAARRTEIPAGFDFVVVARPGSLSAPFDSLVRELEAAILKACQRLAT